MEFNNQLEGVSGDPEIVAKVVFSLGLNSDDLLDPVRSTRIQETINYLTKTSNPELLITKLTSGKQVDKIDHIWSYFKVQEEKQIIDSQLAKTNREFDSLANARGELQAKSDALGEQIMYY